MYKKHKCLFFIAWIVVFGFTFWKKISYEYIASEGITVVSIVLVIYMTSFSGLLSSDLGKRMKNKQDHELKEKTQLGVLRGYLVFAVNVGILNIVLSCVTLVLEEELPNDNKGLIYYFISASGYSTLVVNLLLMILLYKFMVNKQLFDQ